MEIVFMEEVTEGFSDFWSFMLFISILLMLASLVGVAVLLWYHLWWWIFLPVCTCAGFIALLNFSLKRSKQKKDLSE